jgi:hypothetical protein
VSSVRGDDRRSVPGENEDAAQAKLTAPELRNGEELPAACLRGLKKQTWVTAENRVETAAFVPDGRTAEKREDKGKEVSVNWEDNDTVLDMTFENRMQTAHGVARLQRSEVNALNVKTPPPPVVVYERRRDDQNPDNKHHGNLVYRDGLSPPLEKMIAAALALASEFVPRPSNNR